jgi:hypothetical protein
VTVDWRPFEYSTTESYESGKKIFSETIHLELLPNGGTRVHDYAQVILPLPRWLRRMVGRMMVLNKMKYDKMMADAARLAGQEYAKSSHSE